MCLGSSVLDWFGSRFRIRSFLSFFFLIPYPALNVVHRPPPPNIYDIENDIYIQKKSGDSLFVFQLRMVNPEERRRELPEVRLTRPQTQELERLLQTSSMVIYSAITNVMSRYSENGAQVSPRALYTDVAQEIYRLSRDPRANLPLRFAEWLSQQAVTMGAGASTQIPSARTSGALNTWQQEARERFAQLTSNTSSSPSGNIIPGILRTGQSFEARFHTRYFQALQEVLTPAQLETVTRAVTQAIATLPGGFVEEPHQVVPRRAR